jgi:DNA/RNA endonuclease G (NUC1)
VSEQQQTSEIRTGTGIGTRIEGFMEALVRLHPKQFVFGIRERADLAELLLHLASIGVLNRKEQDLKPYLAPLFCGTPQQQKLFYDAFDRHFLPQTGKPLDPPPPSPDSPTVQAASTRSSWHDIAWIPIALSLWIGFWFGAMWVRTLLTPPPSITYLDPKPPTPPDAAGMRKGKVLYRGAAVENATIFVNGTTATSQSDGEFDFPLAGGTTGETESAFLVTHPERGSLLAYRTPGTSGTVELHFRDPQPRVRQFERRNRTYGPPVFSADPISAFSWNGQLAATLDGTTLQFWYPSTRETGRRVSVPSGVERIYFQSNQYLLVLGRNEFRIIHPTDPAKDQRRGVYAVSAFVDSEGPPAYLDGSGVFHATVFGSPFAVANISSFAMPVPFRLDGTSYVVMSSGELKTDLDSAAVGLSSCPTVTSSASLSPDASTIAHLYPQSGEVCVQTTSGKLLHKLPASEAGLTPTRVSFPFSADSRWLLELSPTGRARIRNGATVQTFSTQPVHSAAFLDEGMLVLATTEPRPELAAQTFLQRVLPWILATLPLLALLGLWIWLWLRRSRLRRYPNLDQDLPTARFALPDEPAPPFRASAVFESLATSMRARKEFPIRELDAHGTVMATIDNRGFPTPVYRSRRVRREFVVLCERKGPLDQRWLHFQSLFQRLRSEPNDVRIDLYWFRDDPRYCQAAWTAGGGWISIPELAAQHPDHDLWILADPGIFTDPFTGRLAEWLPEFSRWPDRLILSPTALPQDSNFPSRLALEGWHFALAAPDHLQALLQTGYLSVPGSGASTANSHGLRLPPRFPDSLNHLPSRWLDNRPFPGSESVLSELRAFLGPEAFHVLTGCALYPELHWQLTLFLANRLCNASRIDDALTRLTSLPWFRIGRMPDWLRVRLLSNLQPAAEKKIRAVMDEFLGGLHLQPHGSLQYGRWVTARTPAGEEVVVRDARPVRDYVFLEFLSGRKPDEREALSPPARLRKLLLLQGHAVFGPRVLLTLGLAVTLAASGWIFAKQQDPATGQAPLRVALETYAQPSYTQSDRVPRPNPYPAAGNLATTVILHTAEALLDETREGPGPAYPDYFPPVVAAAAENLLDLRLQRVPSKVAEPGAFYRDGAATGFIESPTTVIEMAADGTVRRLRKSPPPGPYERFVASNSREQMIVPVDEPPKPPQSALRYGYNPGFLPVSIPLPDSNGVWLKYHNFSIVMDPRRPIAQMAIANVDGSKLKSIRRESDTWILDPRIAPNTQPNETLFARNDLDRGHLVFRSLNAWGDTEAEARAAALDVFHLTNAVPQHATLNQRTLARIENTMLSIIRKNGWKATYAAGPILDPKDPVYRGYQIPMRYWSAYIFGPDAAKYIDLDPQTASNEVRISEIERLTGFKLQYPGTHVVAFIVDQTALFRNMALE